MKPASLMWSKAACAVLVLGLAACTSPDKTPATADVAVARNAIETAVSAGAADHAPDELMAARDKLQRASTALAAKDYDRARDLAQQAQADAKLAQSRTASAKATAAAEAQKEGVRVLREEVERTREH